MPSQDVIRRTEELRQELHRLAEGSQDAGTQLGRLESLLNGMSNFNFSSIKEASVVLATFRQNVKLMVGDAAQVDKVTKSFIELTSAIQQAQLTREMFSGIKGISKEKGKLGALSDIGVWDEGQIGKQQDAINRQRQSVEEAKRGLANLEAYWKDALTKADKIIALRKEVFERLFGVGGVPRLEAGAPSRYISPLKSATMFMGPGETLTNYPSREPLPPSRQLPSGRIYLETTRISPEAIRRITTKIDDIVTDRVEEVAQVVDDEPVSPGHTPDEFGGGGTFKTGGRARRTFGGEDLPEMWQREMPVSIDNLKTIGLTDIAAKNLANTLEGLGMKSARVTGNVTELSTGIQTVSFQAEGAGGAIRNLTAHLDRNGNVLQDTQKRFRSFGSAVIRDIAEVLKWTIAITAIYTPIRKMGELSEEMKKVQLDMVDIQVVLGNSTRDMNTVLEASADIATQTSSSLEGVIQGYAQAAAASSSAGNETQRLITTQTLLKDSMVLSKIANIDQKQALDTLVGSLSQLGMNLMQGTQLLDSWVAVSKKANVSVKDMATSFTIVGSAAQEAGLSYNELNALIGTLAQSTNLSADELGNAIRGIIAAMQTDKAQAEFAQYGIATKTVSGDFRDFMDILKEMKSLSQSGILDEKAMGALTQAGGAGARRGAQLSALVKGLPTALDLVTISENASGDAAQALGLEMGTLDAATTRLNNAFTSLAISLGGEGGILGALTFITNAVTFLITQVKGLVSIMKVAAPIMATFLLAKGVMGTSVGVSVASREIPAFLSQLFTATSFAGISAEKIPTPLAGKQATGVLSPLIRKLQGTNLGSTITQTSQGVIPLAVPIGRRATFGEFGTGIGAKLTTPFMGNMNIANILTPALYSIISSLGRPKEEGIPRAMLGGGAGIAVAALTGNTLWATVGSIIATGFYDKFLTFEGDIAESWTTFAAKVRTETGGGAGAEAKTALEGLDEITSSSLNYWERLIVNFSALRSDFMHGLGFGTVASQRAGTILAGMPGTGKEILGPQEALVAAYQKQLGGKWQGLSAETMKEIGDLLSEWAKSQIEQGLSTGTIPLTPVQTFAQQKVAEVAKFAATTSADMINDALDVIASGAQGAIAGYIDIQDSATKLANTAASLITAQTALGQAVNITEGIQPGQKGISGGLGEYVPIPGYKPMSPEEAISFISSLNQEQLSAVTSAYTEIKDALDGIYRTNQEIASMEGGIATEEQTKTLAAYRAELERIAKTFPQIMSAIQQASVVTQATSKLLDIVTLPEMTPDQLQRVRTEADKMWREYLKASGLTDAEIAAFMEAQHEKILQVGEGLSGIKVKTPQNFLSQAAQGLGITGQMPGIIDWSQYTKAQFEQAKSIYPQFVKAIQQAIPGWKPDESTALYFLKDNATVEHLDNTILQMLMRDLIDVEKEKGLQGMYNLPAGATFYIPATAYEMSKATVTEMAGGAGGLSQSDLLALVQALLTQSATQRLAESEQQFLEAQKTGTQELTAVEPGKGFAFGGQEYKMFGPTPQENLLGYTQGNPLPVMVTNWYSNAIGNKEAAPALYDPSVRVKQEYEGYTPKTESPLLSWLDQIGPTFSTLADRISSLIEMLTMDIGIPNTTSLNTQTPNTPVQTALNLSVDSKVVLTVDGRTLATIIKPYLYQDLIRYMTSASSSVNRSVVG